MRECEATSAATGRRGSIRRGQKRAGWRRHGILVVTEQDPRLSWPERELIRELGAKLYGDRLENDR